MSAEDFRVWLAKMGMSRTEAAKRLELSRNTVMRYCDGKSSIPTHVALACAAVSRGIEPWPN